MVFILFSDVIVLTTQHQFAINFGALLESNKLLVSPKGQEDLHKSMQWVLKIVSFLKKVTFSNGGGWEWRGEAPPVHPTGASLERSRREESWRKEKGKRGGELHISSPRFTPPPFSVWLEVAAAGRGGGGRCGFRSVKKYSNVAWIKFFRLEAQRQFLCTVVKCRQFGRSGWILYRIGNRREGKSRKSSSPNHFSPLLAPKLLFSPSSPSTCARWRRRRRKRREEERL